MGERHALRPGGAIRAAATTNTTLLNNENGAQLDNISSASLFVNTAGGVVNNTNGYRTGGVYFPNNSGITSTINNESGALISNGNISGVGLILNGAYTTTPFVPGSGTAFYANDGAILLNQAATINNQNGSHLDNFGTGSVITNTAGAVINNISGYLDSTGTYHANTSGDISTIKNQFGSVISNGDAGGVGVIINGGYTTTPFVPGSGTAFYANDGSILLNQAATINNQNGSHLDNFGTGSVITNTAGAVINNISGYLDGSGTYHANTSGNVSTIKINSGR